MFRTPQMRMSARLSFFDKPSSLGTGKPRYPRWAFGRSVAFAPSEMSIRPRPRLPLKMMGCAIVNSIRAVATDFDVMKFGST